MRLTHLLPLFLAGAGVHGAAVDIAGDRVMQPVPAGSPAPIANPLTYIPDQHDCPLPCRADYSNVHRWIMYSSLDVLQRCQQPMLLQFSALASLDDPASDILLRGCSLAVGAAAAQDQDRTVRQAEAIAVGIENPKTSSGHAAAQNSLETFPACTDNGTEAAGRLRLSTSGATDGDAAAAPGQSMQDLFDGLGGFFADGDNCDETFAFAYHKGMAAGVYIGSGLGKATAAAALQSVAGWARTSGARPQRLVAEICDEGSSSSSSPETVFGLAVAATGNMTLAAVQKMTQAWHQGTCAAAGRSGATMLDTRVFPIAAAVTTNSTNSSNSTSTSPRYARAAVHRRATCKYTKVVPNDSCAVLAKRCGVSGADFERFNSQKKSLCATLMPGDYVCCSAGDPYTEPKPAAPKPNADGSCATHYIANGDTCAQLATRYGITVAQIEAFNKGKTWAYTSCANLLLKYSICVSTGTPPLPPAQQGTECGPMVPGTKASASTPMAELNPCPLKACCSNWGYCGPFPEHCDIHAPKDGGPGTKLPEFATTCVSNCGNDIKKNTGPPAAFSRIGYYESWSFDRPCLWLTADKANTDGSYTHIHWSFLRIQPDSWAVVLDDPHGQWSGFKALPNVKRIVSFGGWAYSTEAATYNIIRQAIIAHADVFAANIAAFLTKEGLDGVDIDWEYPGAPDIMVDGKPIGQKGDGAAYLAFLKTLKQKVGTKSVSIAAPASYWYLKAFPIDQISAAIDYIVYMTYDLHGQWDYGNKNAFDSCDSGKCIRSHVNLTETRNTLSIITKAGAANNKIFVGESSYGRSFHMAVDGCWGPDCQFTGSRTQSDAKAGRCTTTSGFISNAEINEIISRGEGRLLHDGASNTDVLLYQGDYISYMTPTTKDTRRADWKGLNFAGTIDWAVDLQAFRDDDASAPVDRPDAGAEGCVAGESGNLNADALCQFACNYGFCPESTCTCLATGPVAALPQQVSAAEYIAYDDFDVDLQRLCKFACKYGFCPDTTCGQPVVDAWDDGSTDSTTTDKGGSWDKEQNYEENRWQCMVFKTGKFRDAGALQCYNNACKDVVDEAKAEGRTTNYGCVGHFPLNESIPWTEYPGSNDPDMVYATGRCSCDNALVNTIAETVIEALPIIAQIGCYLVMSTLKLVLDIGLDAIPGVGKILDGGLDAVTSAAQVIAYAYPADQDPQGAFEWWLSPCGGSDLVPDDIKNVFGILSDVADGVSSFKTPKFARGSGRKGDPANPIDRSKPKPGTGSGPSGTGSGNSGNSGGTKKKKCNVPAAQSTKIMGAARNTLRVQSCTAAAGGASTTTKVDYVITSLAFGAQPTTVAKVCSQKWAHACYHYSSAIAQNPAWQALPCVHGNVRSPDDSRPGVAKWYQQHDASWRDRADRKEPSCAADEYPPRYLLSDASPEMVNAGKPGGQLMRFLPADDNGGGGSMWKGVCFAPHIAGLTKADFQQKWDAGRNERVMDVAGVTKREVEVDVAVKPYFAISAFEHAVNPPANDGLDDNPCWPSAKAANDPGFALWSWDNWYSTHPHVYDFTKPYSKGSNGA